MATVLPTSTVNVSSTIETVSTTTPGSIITSTATSTQPPSTTAGMMMNNNQSSTSVIYSTDNHDNGINFENYYCCHC